MSRLRQRTEEAIDTLAAIMGDEKAPPSARVSAAQALLDRGWGRAPQHFDIDQTTRDETPADRAPDMTAIRKSLAALH